MPINETIGPGNPESSATVPGDTLSEVSVGKHDTGHIVLEQMVPGGAWEPVDVISRAGTLYTPDPAVQYRFKSSMLEGDTHVYFGP